MDKPNFEEEKKILQIFVTKNLREAFIKKVEKVCFSFGTEIFQPKDFVIWRLIGKLKCCFAQLYLFQLFMEHHRPCCVHPLYKGLYAVCSDIQLIRSYLICTKISDLQKLPNVPIIPKWT